MLVANLNANIDRTAPATFIASTAFASVTVALVLIAPILFAGRVNRPLNNGCSRLSLNLRYSSGYGFRRNQPRSNWTRGERRNLHGFLPQAKVNQLATILVEFNQKIVNLFVVEWELDKLLIINLFSLVRKDNIGLSRCKQVVSKR